MNDKSISTKDIWELLSEKLKNFLLKRVSDEQIAEDLLQETFIRIHKKLDDLDDTQRITPWVFQIARNLVIDHYRSKLPEVANLADEMERSTDGKEQNLNEQVSGWLSKMVSALPKSYREAVELYELEGISQKEISDRLGISLSGAKSRVQRGRKKLKSMLFDCCSFQQDRRGNIIGYLKNDSTDCANCNDSCEC